MRIPAVLAACMMTVCAGASAATSVPAAPATPLAAHHALYELKLDNSKGGDVIAANGTMGYEVIDACDGWAVRQRLQLTITNADGQDVQMMSDYATWESKDGLRFRFHMKQTTDTAVTSQTDGVAKLDSIGGTGEAHYTSPSDSVKKLPPGTLFPMAHTAAIIAGAREGKKFLALPLFDGTDEGGVEDSSIVILDWKPPFATKWPELNPLPSTRVHLAFFDHQANAQTPNYEVTMRYWENGVGDDMKMDFGDFVAHATMSEFALQPHKC